MRLLTAAVSIKFLLLAAIVHGYPYRRNSEHINLDWLGNEIDETINSFFNVDNAADNLNNELNYQNGQQGDENFDEDLEENVEDDIIIPLSKPRNGLKAVSARWPRGDIPYIISSKFDAKERKLIKEAMDIFHKNTCVRFKPYTGMERDFINIRRIENGCNSNVGRIGGSQNLNLSPICANIRGKIMHELMHAIGFHHEQSRSDRDDYVKIVWDNIREGHKQNFKKFKPLEVDDFGVSYDYGSILHYGPKAFSRNEKPTIIVRGNEKVTIGQRERLSVKDIKKIRRMYKCK